MPASGKSTLLPALRAILATVPRRGPDQLVFPTASAVWERLKQEEGTTLLPKGEHRHGPSNVRRRVLGPAVELANTRLEQRGEVPLPERLTPHKLRHTFASLLVALGVDPGAVMDQLGHKDAGFTLRVYRHGMRRDEASREALRALVGAVSGSTSGSNVVPVEFAARARAR